MTLLANLLWIVFGGFVLAIEYWIGGLFLCVTVVGIPFGMQAFKLGSFALLPFGKQLRDRPASGVGGLLQLVLNIVWLVFIGLPIAMTHITAAIACAISIIGIPFAIQHVKMVPLALLPFGKDWKEAP
ncbi:MAG: YccF domain-containing protein [Cyanobacteria bacterium J06639_1]